MQNEFDAPPFFGVLFATFWLFQRDIEATLRLGRLPRPPKPSEGSSIFHEDELTDVKL